MKKQYFILISLASGLSFGQTATDFNVSDCAGNSHHLFTDLDSGKVIVIDWVMPCYNCIIPSQTTYNLVQSYQSKYPGKVLFYMSGNPNCNTIKNWATTNNIPSPDAVITDAAVRKFDYGVTGMPKIVILGGGSSHLVYFNEIDTAAGNLNHLKSALDQAIVESVVGVKENKKMVNDLSVFPNPAKQAAVVSYTLTKNTEVNAELYTITGEKIKIIACELQLAGKHQLEINTTGLSDGIYFINVNNSLLKLEVCK